MQLVAVLPAAAAGFAAGAAWYMVNGARRAAAMDPGDDATAPRDGSRDKSRWRWTGQSDATLTGSAFEMTGVKP